MKLKYYMRGLGIGIILTTLILSLGGMKEKLTDKEIIQRAGVLGMVMEKSDSELDDVLSTIKPTIIPSAAPTSEITKEPTAEPTSEPTEAPTEAPTVAPTAEPTAKPTAVPTAEPTAVPTPVVEITPPKEVEGKITFTIKKGMISSDVAQLLKDSGIIKDADDFNQYIIKVGKDSFIRIGTYSFPKDITYEEIVAKIAK